jgi:hypothetical protein
MSNTTKPNKLNKLNNQSKKEEVVYYTLNEKLIPVVNSNGTGMIDKYGIDKFSRTYECKLNREKVITEDNQRICVRKNPKGELTGVRPCPNVYQDTITYLEQIRNSIENTCDDIFNNHQREKLYELFSSIIELIESERKFINIIFALHNYFLIKTDMKDTIYGFDLLIKHTDKLITKAKENSEKTYTSIKNDFKCPSININKIYIIISNIFESLFDDKYLNHVFKSGVICAINIENKNLDISNHVIDENYKDKYLCSYAKNFNSDMTVLFQRCMKYKDIIIAILKSCGNFLPKSNDIIQNSLSQFKTEYETSKGDLSLPYKHIAQLYNICSKQESNNFLKELYESMEKSMNYSLSFLDKMIKYTDNYNKVNKVNEVESFKLYFDDSLDFKDRILNLLDKKTYTTMNNNEKSNLHMGKEVIINKNFNPNQKDFINLIDPQIILDSYVGIVYFSYLNLTKQMSGGNLRKFFKPFGTKHKPDTQVNAVNRVNPVKQPSINDLSKLKLYNFAYMSFSLKNKITNTNEVEQFLNTYWKEIVNVMNNKNGNKPVITLTNNLPKNHLNNSTAGGSRKTKTRKTKTKSKTKTKHRKLV